MTPAAIAGVFKQAGLLPLVHVQQPGHSWPTLRQMIDSGHRLVVLTEHRSGGRTYPWILNGFRQAQDTPYTNPTVADLSCRLNRGRPGNPLFLINNWLSGFSSLVSNARKVNSYQQLWSYVHRCQRVRGHLPNFVAVNYYNEGGLFRVVNRLNRAR